MKMKGQGFRWKRALRRAAALFFATIALWMLGLTCDFGAACAQLGENSSFIVAALRAELGPETWAEGIWAGLDSLQQLALGQSALLRAGQADVERLLAAREVTPDETDTQGSDDTQESTDAQDQTEGEDDEETLPQTTTAPEDIVERTLVASDTERYLSADGVYLYNYTSQTLDTQALASAEIGVELQEDGPQILIMHTHGTEAYTMDGEDIYEESDTARTTDDNYNVIRIGDEMQSVFEEMGLSVIHDRTLYDYPQYNGAYDRSYAGVESWLEQYPSIQVVLDVHRDALVGDDGTVYKVVTDVDDEKTAQVLLVVGTDDSGLEHPYWTQNLALAIQIQKKMDEQWPTLARPITLRSSRFNQQLTKGSLLVEVGSHGNTLQEAIRGARLFAQATGEVLLELLAEQSS